MPRSAQYLRTTTSQFSTIKSKVQMKTTNTSRLFATNYNTLTCLTVLLVSLMHMAAQAQTPAFLTNGLVAYYPLNGNANDASGRGNNGVISGNVLATNVSARNAFHFDGKTAFVTVAYLPEMNQLPLTCCAWVCPDFRTDEGVGGLKVVPFPNNVLSDDIPAKYGHGFGCNAYSGGMAITVEFHNGFDVVSSVAFKSNVWLHIATVYTSGAANTYVNGNFVKSTNLYQAALTGSNQLLIGKHNDDISNYASRRFFKGCINDVRIYNRALSASEVKALYAYESVPPRQATATSQIANGFVVGVTITDGGFGYTNAPAIAFAGGGGTGATATSTIDINGSVTSITVLNSGHGYTNAPAVVIAPPPFPPRQATANAQLANGFVVGVTLTDGGFGYSVPPRVWFIGGGGSLAAASSAIDSNGVISEITITDPGSDYSTNVQIVIEPPVFPVPSIATALSEQLLFSALQPGTNYQVQRLAGTTWSSLGATVSTTNSTFSTNVAGRGNYRLAQLPLPQTALASPTVMNGFLVGITVTNGGSGYTTPPAVAITDTTGAGAAATASVAGGAVTSIAIQSPGRNYSSSPTITIGSPAVVSIAGSATPTLTLNLSNLVPGLPYQIEQSGNLNEFQSLGDPFVPAETNYDVTRAMTATNSFYRVVYKR